MALQVKGKLKLKGDIQAVNDRFRKREFVLTDDSTQYPQHITFQLTQDKCPLIDNINPGDEMTVHFNLRGREWTSPKGEVKYFNSLEAWKIEKGNAGQSADSHYEAIPDQTFRQNEATDDLPF